MTDDDSGVRGREEIEERYEEIQRKRNGCELRGEHLDEHVYRELEKEYAWLLGVRDEL